MRGRMNATGWIDCYFENVGGAITDSVFPLMNPNGRVAICGQIALYNLEKPDLGARVLPLVLVRTLTVKGFLVFQYARVRRGAPAACQMAPGGQAEISGDRS
jgi:NADPH-dependent curcumin reductase CurA